MRGKLSYIIISLCAFLALGSWDAYAIKDWGDKDYEYNTSNAPISNDKIIYLSDHINLKQPIVIKKGAKVTIRRASTAPKDNLYFYNGQGTSGTRMFVVESGGILQIIGDEDYKFVINGQASGASSFTWNTSTSGSYSLTVPSNAKELYEAIQNMGTLKLENVTIKNVLATRDLNGGAIQICTQGANLPNGTTDIKNCKITLCKAPHGSAIHIDGQKACTSNTADKCKITIENTEIYNCWNVGSDDDDKKMDDVLAGGGTIRSRGEAVSSLVLTNTQVYENRSISGGGLYWNAGGLGDGKTKCTINGCRFEKNRVTREGGGMMLEASFEFTGNETVVSENYAQNHGGGIAVTGYSGGQSEGGLLNFNLTNSLKIENNDASDGGGISFLFGNMTFNEPTTINVVINGCNILNNTAFTRTVSGEVTGGRGGALYFRNSSTNKDVTVNILMNKGNFLNNEAKLKGGAMYVENTTIKHSDNLASSAVINIQNNTVTQANSGYDGGGGIYLLTGNVELGRANITGNTSSYDGGGIYIKDGSLDLMENTVIEQNTAGRNGGGLWVEYEDQHALYIRKNTKLTSNTAARTGGGAMINKGNIIVDYTGHLEVLNNTSKKGGGAYVVGSLYVRGTSKISGNKVTYNSSDSSNSGKGGGVFVSTGHLIVGDYNTTNANIEISDNQAEISGGGVHIQGGDVKIMSTCKISGNRADASGGAISVTTGEINIAAGEISNNYAAQNGGAVYANNSFENAASTIKLLGDGVYKNNNAQHGGGMYVGGNIKMTFAGSFINNKATNGGGLFVSNGAQLTITGGFLRQNRAISTAAKPSTGYQTSASNLNGIGGGVYLNNGNSASYPTKLNFALTGNSIGIYDNSADWGADDVFASGKNTSITLPNINQMTITDFETPANTPLYWAEDYITNDEKYGNGTKLKSTWDSDKTNDRYNFALKNSRNIYHITFEDSEQSKVFTNYMSHKVGYELIFVTLVKKGLNPGENAVFTFTPATKKISDTVYEVETGTKPYQNVIFVCKNSDQTTNGVVRKLAIPSGWWKIEETSWSWAYNANNGTQYDNPVKIDADHKEFEFKNVRKANTPKTDEDIVENQMKSSINTITASE